MPLQQINVSPAESSKNEVFLEQQVIQDYSGRSESQISSHSSGSTNVEICRICHCEGDADAGLIAPCYCSGSLRYVHQICLQQWIKSSNTRCCELCRFQFIMHTKTKPFTEWEPLDMNGFERRKLLCAVMFHAIALTCVVWSLYVLIDRTAEEIKQGLLEWPFWTKLIVVAIGFTGGVVFMYIQCKAYMQICQRWKAYNRVIYVQNAPEKQPLSISRVSTAQACKSTSDYHSALDCGRDGTKVENGKDETSIDLKGVRNVHIFFKDENQVCVQNEQHCAIDDDTGCEGNASCSQRPDETSMWHIKIGKGVPNDSSSSLRCNELDGLMDHQREDHQGLSRSHAGDQSATIGSDSVLKLQIKKAEIVIQFGQKATGGGSGGGGGESSCDDGMMTASVDNKKDTSVNIKIDDKESEPIVIDLVKKAPPPQGMVGSDAAKDPLQLRFGFGQDRGCDLDESGCAKLLGGNTEFSVAGDTQCEYPHSGTDSGSQSPLLTPKNHIQD